MLGNTDRDMGSRDVTQQGCREEQYCDMMPFFSCRASLGAGFVFTSAIAARRFSSTLRFCSAES